MATRMAGEDPSGTESTGISNILSHIAFNPIGQPEPYKHGDYFYQFSIALPNLFACTALKPN